MHLNWKWHTPMSNRRLFAIGTTSKIKLGQRTNGYRQHDNSFKSVQSRSIHQHINIPIVCISYNLACLFNNQIKYAGESASRILMEGWPLYISVQYTLLNLMCWCVSNQICLGISISTSPYLYQSLSLYICIPPVILPSLILPSNAYNYAHHWYYLQRDKKCWYKPLMHQLQFTVK